MTSNGSANPNQVGPTYNGRPIPSKVRVDRILPAFVNPLTWEKVSAYETMFQHGQEPPPITGYPSTIEEGDVGSYYMSSDLVREEHVGQPCWYVVNGHHRVTAASEAGVDFLTVTMDQECFTNLEELHAYRRHSAEQALRAAHNIVSSIRGEWPELAFTSNHFFLGRVRTVLPGNGHDTEEMDRQGPAFTEKVFAEEIENARLDAFRVLYAVTRGPAYEGWVSCFLVVEGNVEWPKLPIFFKTERMELEIRMKLETFNGTGKMIWQDESAKEAPQSGWGAHVAQMQYEFYQEPTWTGD